MGHGGLGLSGFAILYALAGHPAQAREPATDNAAGDLRAEIVGRIVFVEGTVNGKGPLKFIVDTGATETILTPAAAELAGVRAAPGARGLRQGSVKTISAGSAAVSQLSVFVFDPPQALSLRLDKGINYSGILGYTFLSRFITTIDFGRQRVRFTPVDSYPRRATKAAPGTWVVPFLLRNSLIFVPGQIGDTKTVNFLLDTGAAETLLTPAAASRLGVASKPLAGYTGVSTTLLPRIVVGGATVSNVNTIIHVPPQDLGGKVDYAGILGHPFLSHFVVTINYRDKEVTFEPSVDNPGPRSPAGNR